MAEDVKALYRKAKRQGFVVEHTKNHIKVRNPHTGEWASGTSSSRCGSGAAFRTLRASLRRIGVQC